MSKQDRNCLGMYGHVCIFTCFKLTSLSLSEELLEEEEDEEEEDEEEEEDDEEELEFYWERHKKMEIIS